MTYYDRVFGDLECLSEVRKEAVNFLTGKSDEELKRDVLEQMFIYFYEENKLKELRMTNTLEMQEMIRRIEQNTVRIRI